MHARTTRTRVMGLFAFCSLWLSNLAIAFTSYPGNTPGSFAVSPSGAATYTIPIRVPAGPQGLQPNIALVYNSQQGNSTLGVGWSLSGLGSIYRCNQTYAQDGAPGAVTLTGSDVFCMSGVRLRLISGTYGQPNSTYQTEIANFSNVTAWGTAGNGPSYFTVQTPDGHTYTYGSNINGTVLANGSTTAVSWMLTEVTDKAGNSMQIDYSTAIGTAVPALISWTQTSYTSGAYQNTMRFAYGANVSQSSTYGYVAGTAVANTNLLSSITVSASGGVVRKYVLSYGTAPTTGRDILVGVQECADTQGTTCLRPTTMTYQPGSSGVGSATTLGNSAGQILQYYTAYDLNGDGRPDIVWLDSNGWEVSFANGSGYSAPVSTGITTSAIAIEDIDGSGTDSLLVPVSGAWSYYKWNGSSFGAASTGIAVDSTGAYTFALADVNGDGLPDLITTGSDGHVYLRLNTSSPGAVSFSATRTQTINSDSATFTSGYGGSRRLDFYGAGQQDLFAAFPGPPRLIDAVSHFNGTTFLDQAISSSGIGPVDLADFNDDGCTDILGLTSLTISQCAGTTGELISFSGGAVAALDWDGDGRRDILVNNGGSTLGVLLSTGSGVSTAALSTSLPATGVQYASLRNPTGDGQDGLVSFATSSPYTIQYYLHNGAGQPPDLLASVTDGYGNSVQPTYVSITQAVGSYFFPRTDAPAGYQNYVGPLYVVNGATYSDPTVAGGTYLQQNFYAGAWMNEQGRGFAGFEADQTLDSRNGIYETFAYNLQFPYTGMLVGDTKTENNTPATTLSQTTNTPSCMLVGGSGACGSPTGPTTLRYFPYVSNSQTLSYELGATSSAATRLIKTTTSTYAYDNYGNSTITSTSVTDNDTGSPYYGQSWVTTTTNTTDPDASAFWCLTLITEQQIVYTGPSGTAPVTRTRSFTPDTQNCRYNSIVTEPDSTLYKVTESLNYDSFGNLSLDFVTGVGMAARRYRNVTYDVTGVYPSYVIDPSGATTHYVYNQGFGTVATKTDPNGLTTTWNIDSFGRTTQELRPDNTSTTWTYNDCSTQGSCPITAHALAVTQTVLNSDLSVETDSTTWLDALQRPVVAEQRMLANSTYSRVDTRYDNRGNVVQTSPPCTFVSVVTACPYMVTTAYDVLNRPRSVQRPTSATNSSPATTTITYAGDVVTTQDPQGKQRVITTNAAGMVGQTEDDAGYYINFSHDAFGSPLGAVDRNGVTLETAVYQYGIAPFRTTFADADLGTRQYTFDALGEITGGSDLRGNTFTETYDALSRPLTRSEPDMSTSWTWGNSASSHNIGKIQSISASGYTDAYTYDSLARLSDRTITIPSDATYSYDLSYSSTTGLLDTLTYPTSTSSYRLKLQYGYQNGILAKISDFNALTTVFWQADAATPAGQFSQETLGNGVVMNRSWDAVTGVLNSSQAGVGGGTILQNNSYLFDQVGNLIQRQDNNRGLTESYQYDDLYRLRTSTLNNTANLSATYDSTGNLLTLAVEGGPASTQDFQTHQTGCTYYANAQPHAIHSSTSSTAGTLSYCYDANGNGVQQIQGGVTVGSAQWTSYNQPSLLTSYTGASSQFAYDYNHQRYKHLATFPDGTTETTIYAGKRMEKVTSASGTAYRYYIRAGSNTIVYTRWSTGSTPTYYVLTDHLGNGTLVTDASGATVVAENYAPLGYRRGSNWTGSPTASDMGAIATTTRRGFTGHEMLDNLGLIDMNGRINSATGQFLSPDPILQDPMNTQSFNRYAYALNNPLTFTDPSGFDCWDPFDPSTAGDRPGDVAGEWAPCPGGVTPDPPPILTPYPPDTPPASSGGQTGSYTPPAQHGSGGPTQRGDGSDGQSQGDEPTSEVTITAQRPIPFSYLTCAKGGFGCDPTIPPPVVLCGGGGFFYFGPTIHLGPVHGELLGIISYDSEDGGQHGGLIAGKAGPFSGGFEALRTWSTWQETISPIGFLNSPPIKVGPIKNDPSKQLDVGGLLEGSDGDLSIGLYGGGATRSGVAVGTGGYVHINVTGSCP